MNNLEKLLKIEKLILNSHLQGFLRLQLHEYIKVLIEIEKEYTN